MIDCSSTAHSQLIEVLAAQNGNLSELHLNYLKDSIENPDKKNVITKIVQRCTSLKKLTVSNMSRLPIEARQALA